MNWHTMMREWDRSAFELGTVASPLGLPQGLDLHDEDGLDYFAGWYVARICPEYPLLDPHTYLLGRVYAAYAASMAGMGRLDLADVQRTLGELPPVVAMTIIQLSGVEDVTDAILAVSYFVLADEE